jgi:flagellin
MASILNNVAALGASRQLGITNLGMQRTIERLTTGKRINRANDDAAGLVTANGLQAQVRIATQGRRNAMDGYTTLQTNDGYLEESTALALRAVELAAIGSNTATDAEWTQVKAAMDAIFTNLSATVSVTAGSYSSTTTIGAPTALGAAVSASGAQTTLDAINTKRGTIGASMQALLSYANVLGIESENKTAQASQIMDADIGAEVVNLSKWQILNQSGISALAQANTAGQAILGLLR